ncbi:hypothetical protein HK100_011903 [Physocladia obscura]|uniref:Clu domain-containing protein n=1 Tax=Physocladia obscura TaxID=109957 RepID=A0AAD5XCW5_9FUNG|nr:hypothetical protein HK100_011903 [Physocladia obscura]
MSLRPPNPDAALQKDIQLLELIGAFEETATQHAIRMVEEHHLQGPIGKQESSAVSNAPGAIFRLTSSTVASPEEVDAAISRTSAELRSIDSFNRAAHDAGVDGNTALMVLIDYKGFRVVAYADMGIDERTTPSFDLRSNPLKCDESALARLSLIGKELNLKPHGVQIGEDRRVNVHLSANIQMHFDQEFGRNYTVNLFEIMPIDFQPHQPSANSSPARSPTRQDSKLMPSMMAPSQNPSPLGPNKLHRLRSEFLKQYASTVSSDAFTSASGCGRKERDLNDSEALRASAYLREVWIPDVVKRFDDLEIRPLSAVHISSEIRKFGINVRHLGLIAQLSHIPYIRDMACIEMVARAFKSIFVTRLRSLMIHFRSVGATQIDEETKSFTCNMFSTALGIGDKAIRLNSEIQFKFEYEIEEKHYFSLHRPAIFSAMQHHCGVLFDESSDYNFQSPNPCPRTRFQNFIPRRKHPTGLKHLLQQVDKAAQKQATNQPTIGDDERLAYTLTRHFRSMGPKSKLQRSDGTALELTAVAAHYNLTDRPEEAKRYAIAAISACVGKTTSAVSTVARAQLIEAMGALLVPSNSERFTINMAGCGDGSGNFDLEPVIRIYQQGVTSVKWNWGISHPMGMALHDRLSGVYIRCGKYEDALNFHEMCLEIAMASFGKNHVVTVGYLTKSGILNLYLKNTEESAARLIQALQIAKSISAPSTLVAQIYGYIASALDLRGDLGSALENAQKARKMWEKAKGQMDPRSVAANLQTATLLLKPYESYKGVLTPAIRTAYREAITCFEKVFRFLKNTAAMPTGNRGTSIISSRASSVSIDSYISSRSSRAMTSDSSASFASGQTPTPFVGPAVMPPFAPLPQFPKSILHKLTKKIVTLKLALVESPHHKDVIRTLRSAKEDGVCVPMKLRGSSTLDCTEVTSFDPMMAREVVIKMAAVSPSIYLDGVLARIDDDDGSAIDELAIAIQLAESDSLGLSG